MCSTLRGKHKHPKVSKAVIQIDIYTNTIVMKYDSMYQAYKDTGARNISKCCKGEAKSSGGYKWMYADEYESAIEDFNTPLLEADYEFEDLM